MSKSLGNTVVPQQVIAESGAEVLRLWVVDGRLPRRGARRQGRAGADGRGLPEDPQHVPLPAVEPLRLRPSADAILPREALRRGRPIRPRAARAAVGARVDDGLSATTTSRPSSTPSTSFVTVDLSAFYADVVKDRLYTFHADVARTAVGADRQLSHRRRRSRGCWRRFCRSRWTKSGATCRARARRRSTGRVPSRTRDGGSTTRSSAVARGCSRSAAPSIRRSRAPGSTKKSAARWPPRRRSTRAGSQRDLLERYRSGPADAVHHVRRDVDRHVRRRRWTSPSRRPRRQVSALLAVRRRERRPTRRAVRAVCATRSRPA